MALQKLRSPKIRRLSVVDQVSDSIKQSLLDQVWKEGDKLPSEGELAEYYGVNRLSVRMALQKLSTLGLIETRVGEGSFVAHFSVQPIFSELAPLYDNKEGRRDEEQLRKEQQLLLDYARMAVTEENVGLLAKQALAARSAVAASTLAEEYPRDFARIIGLHTYSQSPRRAYDITLTGNWVERGGFRFEEFILTPRREDADHGRTE